MPDYLLTKHEVPIAKTTLAKLASIGGGPAITYSGRTPLYHVDDLDRWAEDRLSTPVETSNGRRAAA